MSLLKLLSVSLLLLVLHGSYQEASATVDPEYWDLPDCSAAKIKQYLYRICIEFKRSANFYPKSNPMENELEFMEGTPRQHFTKMLGRYFRTALMDSDEDSLDGPVMQRYPTRYYVPSDAINSTNPLATYYSMNAIRDQTKKMMYYANKYDTMALGKDTGTEFKGGRRYKRNTNENSLANRVKRQIETLIAQCCTASGCNKMDFVRLENIYPICTTDGAIPGLTG